MLLRSISNCATSTYYKAGPASAGVLVNRRMFQTGNRSSIIVVNTKSIYSYNLARATPSTSGLSRPEFYKSCPQFQQTNCRFLYSSRNMSQRVQSESTVSDSSSVLEQKIKEKFGSRLVGWDPRETNGGEPSVIYKGILEKQIRSLKIFSFGTTVIAAALQGYLLENLNDSSLLAKAGVFSFVGFFMFASPVLIHLMAKRYVTELSYDPQSDLYTSVTYSFFLTRNELQFKVDDVIVPTVPGMLTTLFVKSGDKKIPLFLADFCFHDLKHFGRLMGYDKPIDFGITATDIESELKRRKESTSKANTEISSNNPK